MEDILDVYTRKYDKKRPLACMDEVPRQLIGEVRIPIPGKPGKQSRFDTEYKRNGTCVIFMVSAPLKGWRRADRYYISNADMSAIDFYRRIRGHWSIENRLHWSLDVVFGEDASQVSRGHAPENLNILRKMALSLLRAAENPLAKGKRKMTGPKKRFIASMNPNYMFTVLFGK